MRIHTVGVSPRLLPSHSVQGSHQQPSFSQFLSEGLQRVRALHADADEAVLQLTTGQTDNLHQVMIAMERASLALELTVAIRNKLVDAYQEIMRMQV